MPVGRGVAIPLREVVIRASRSSGPGGQHANVTASRIEATFDVAASSALSDAQRRRVIARLGPRVVAVAQDARSQARHREPALERWAAAEGDEVTVVFERPPSPPIRSTVIDVLHAPKRKRDAADDEIIRLLRADPDPSAIRVVTSDRWLADRAWAAGASVEGAESFRARLDD